MRLLMTAGEVEADRPRWHKTRLADEDGGARVGGSDIAGLLGMTRQAGAYSSAYKLWMIKTGRWPDDDTGTDQMDFGTFCEPFSRRLLARDFSDLHYAPGGLYCNDKRSWQISTFDLLAHEAGGCAERDEMGTDPPPSTVTVQQKNVAFCDWADAGVPAAYRAQGLWEYSTHGDADMALLAPFDHLAVKVDLFELLDDHAEADIALMLETAEWFRDLVRRDVPPPVDGHPATGEALRRRWQVQDETKEAVVPWRAAARWRRAGRAETAAKRRKERYLNELLAAAQDAGVWSARNPATGQYEQVATRKIGKRRGYSVEPNDHVDTVRPCDAFKPW